MVCNGIHTTEATNKQFISHYFSAIIVIIFTIPLTPTVGTAERQSAQMSKITNDGLTRSGT